MIFTERVSSEIAGLKHRQPNGSKLLITYVQKIRNQQAYTQYTIL
jgi:hypothetical protein